MVTVVAARRIAQDFLVQYCISISRKIILLEELIATPTKLREDIALQYEYFVRKDFHLMFMKIFIMALLTVVTFVLETAPTTVRSRQLFLRLLDFAGYCS